MSGTGKPPKAAACPCHTMPQKMGTPDAKAVECPVVGYFELNVWHGQVESAEPARVGVRHGQTAHSGGLPVPHIFNVAHFPPEKSDQSLLHSS